MWKFAEKHFFVNITLHFTKRTHKKNQKEPSCISFFLFYLQVFPKRHK
jgi:hypothetical protein